VLQRVDVLIVGCGPCGLGAAWRLQRLRDDGATDASYAVVDAAAAVGGSATSAITGEGFTFDYGGHILYPHRSYDAFSTLLATLIPNWHNSVPARGVWIDGRLIPYPVQHNIHRLRTGKMLLALGGLVENRVRRSFSGDGPGGRDLQSYLNARFGRGLTRTVMGPLNEKMWASDLRDIDSCWTSLRSGSAVKNVAEIDLSHTLRSIVSRRDTLGWTPETTVRYPARGGSGAIWSALAGTLPANRMLFNARIVDIDPAARVATLEDGRRLAYRSAISTIPLDELLRILGGTYASHPLRERLHFSQAFFIGFGLRGEPPAALRAVHSFHSPQNDMPCWRINVPSNLSPGNVPSGDTWSIMCEISRPKNESFDLEAATDTIVRRLLAHGLFSNRRNIVSIWNAHLRHGYPVPFLGRDVVLDRLHDALRPTAIVSRGRFGGWKYEVSNQDHTFMQGVEAVDSLLLQRPETTYAFPERID
jgi:protoporphyrinogen oxidase